MNQQTPSRNLPKKKEIMHPEKTCAWIPPSLELAHQSPKVEMTEIYISWSVGKQNWCSHKKYYSAMK